MIKRLFQSKALIFSLIFSFVFLITTEAAPRKINSDLNEDFRPIVKVKEAADGVSPIQKFTSGGSFVTKLGTAGNGDGQFNLPMCVAVDNIGNVYVSDTLNHRIQKFAPASSVQKKANNNNFRMNNHFLRRNLRPRFGHLNPQGIKRLEKKQRLTDRETSKKEKRR